MIRQKPSTPAKRPKAPSEANVGDHPKKRTWHNIASNAVLLLAVPLLTFLLITFVFQSFQVSGNSMEHTLQNGDRLIVWKVPRTVARLTRHGYIPARGDVIVFNSPSLHEIVIKRVVALPGERVVVSNGTLVVYNQDHPQGFNPDTTAGFPQTIVTPTAGKIDVVVQDGQVFVCGDNRGNSIDSRTFGAIASHDIIGLTAFRILPLNKLGSYL